MNMQWSLNWLENLVGWSAPDVYSTAWVALVPAQDNPRQPAWPEAVEYLRAHQLADGGWGAPHIYYAHERTVSTLAAIHALHMWQMEPLDAERIKRGLQALWRYADDLAHEPVEPIGFELILPRLRAELRPAFDGELPLEKWAPVNVLSERKLALIHQLRPDPDSPRAWWFSLEMLAPYQLAGLEDSILDTMGTVATSTAATAAYLAARRRAGTDSPRASHYLSQLLTWGEGGVPFCWPFDVFERVWVLDSLKRAGLDPHSPAIAPLVKAVGYSWDLNDPGLSYSDLFNVNDGDDTLVGFALLNWAGINPPDDPVLAFWDTDHFRSYLDERSPSLSANIHALAALRAQPGFPRRELAQQVTDWLIGQMNPHTLFDDKWHISPFYSIAHAIPAFAGWKDDVARHCTSFLIRHQQPDGGWGGFGRSTLEETAHCVLGLYQAYSHGLFRDRRPFMRAAQFFETSIHREPREQLWIGKTLFRPEGIVQALLFAASSALEQVGCAVQADAWRMSDRSRQSNLVYVDSQFYGG